jgi:hypothetical protein
MFFFLSTKQSKVNDKRTLSFPVKSTNFVAFSLSTKTKVQFKVMNTYVLFQYYSLYFRLI